MSDAVPFLSNPAGLTAPTNNALRDKEGIQRFPRPRAPLQFQFRPRLVRRFIPRLAKHARDLSSAFQSPSYRLLRRHTALRRSLKRIPCFSLRWRSFGVSRLRHRTVHPAKARFQNSMRNPRPLFGCTGGENRCRPCIPLCLQAALSQLRALRALGWPAPSGAISPLMPRSNFPRHRREIVLFL